ncbi:ImmA/IrrE family metallo-endopeptidase [Variovorax sp. Root434]|uniref:ImmA/IrrE family metallo-endopeptidase n=1 Tax=Variovorax sp. Root434 TaxID=1736536 RepID=UPI0006FDE25C|nr:ImmA/IrrE family metallo-endopeptidase [Variovorax sp. Root434]KQX22128.1 hypothetical protein ASD05_14340 [Variovorax sp. Root434]
METRFFLDVEGKAANLLRQADALRAPVDVRKVARHLDAQVHEQTLEDVVSGVLVIRGDERHIMVNKAHHPNRQRFSIAHELGHLVLHHKQGDNLFIDKHLSIYQRVGSATSIAYQQPGSSTTPADEREANQFASALLMPKELLLFATKDRDLWDELDIATLASQFGVSEQAMTIRLRQLGILDSEMFH